MTIANQRKKRKFLMMKNERIDRKRKNRLPQNLPERTMMRLFNRLRMSVNAEEGRKEKVAAAVVAVVVAAGVIMSKNHFWTCSLTRSVQTQTMSVEMVTAGVRTTITVMMTVQYLVTVTIPHMLHTSRMIQRKRSALPNPKVNRKRRIITRKKQQQKTIASVDLKRRRLLLEKQRNLHPKSITMRTTARSKQKLVLIEPRRWQLSLFQYQVLLLDLNHHHRPSRKK
mmetsp:Transcript_10420/g.14718  ORF Transcript_10420/g.14718 Transcript_10420/m.14718 type:complete len:226 (-) Transcript_10420:1507-2184(-)